MEVSLAVAVQAGAQGLEPARLLYLFNPYSLHHVNSLGKRACVYFSGGYCA